MDKSLNLKRVPQTNHPSLKAWSAADELMVQSNPTNEETIGIYNDAFGYLTCHLANQNPFIITDLKSQAAAIHQNATNNDITVAANQFYLITDELPKQLEKAYLKIPKSIALFETYLQHIHSHLSSNGQVICGFMTKYFNANLLEMATKYFENVEQSKAKKKARLLILSGKKNRDNQPSFEQFQYHHLKLEQHKGVFSAGKVDKATNYLLQNIKQPKKYACILDLACGNGIIGKWILDKIEIEELHFLDDSNLAITSAKRNVKNENTQFHHNFDLSDFKENSLDWIITNPPFHFENTIDTSIPINLFKEAKFKLKEGGTLTIVANSNLGYESFLKHHFSQVKIEASNHQFKIYTCS